MSNDINSYDSVPPEGTPEFDQYMRHHFGDDYELGYRVGFGKRLGAYLLDWLFTGILSGIVAFATGTMTYLMENIPNIIENMQEVETAIYEIVPITSIITLIYFSTEIFFAASPGKMLLNIKIANENRTEGDTNNLILRFILKHGHTILNYLAVIVSISLFESLGSLYLLALVVGFFFTLSIKRQAFHDMISKTAVFNKENLKNY